ncbi:MAG: hypothetical protein CM1200mP2_04400 [Planctomycetaceae bacterium]|nr:MAG: hypothetical protein CM1200mP2_04400 [Planctomycetaceae bacterium]
MSHAEEMKIGAKLIDWKAKWHAHGKGGGKSVKRGLGMALHRWGGPCRSHDLHRQGASRRGGRNLPGQPGPGHRHPYRDRDHPCRNFRPGNQRREGQPREQQLPEGQPVGRLDHRRRRLRTAPGGPGLEALWGKSTTWSLPNTRWKPTRSRPREARSSPGPGKSVCTWKQACGLLGPMPLEVQGQGPKNDGLTSQGVAGIQMADVSVDIETGIVRINELVAVQDCGLIIDELTARSQVYGGLIMGIAYALSEERVMDNRTGRFINADLENYKLPRIGDIGKLKVHMYQPDSEYERGVVGLGEPPVISTGAAISNAVANATGVRVPVQPLTPQRVLEALKGGQA